MQRSNEYESEDIGLPLAIFVILVMVVTVYVLAITSDAHRATVQQQEQANQEKLIDACTNRTGIFKVSK